MGIPSPEKLPHFHFMFLIDMKFISKFLQMCLWKIYHFPILISTKIFLRIYTQNKATNWPVKAINNRSKNQEIMEFGGFGPWHNKIQISLSEWPKTQKSMISWFLDLLLMAFIGQLMALLANEWLNWCINGLININRLINVGWFPWGPVLTG